MATERHVAFSLKRAVWQEKDVQTRLALTYHDLTTREREVAALAIKGRSAKETAEILGVAMTTVITHRNKAYKRMNVTSLHSDHYVSAASSFITPTAKKWVWWLS